MSIGINESVSADTLRSRSTVLDSPITLKPSAFITVITPNGNNLSAQINFTPKTFLLIVSANGNDLSANVNIKPQNFISVITANGNDLNSVITFKPATFITAVSQELPELDAPVVIKPYTFLSVISTGEPPVYEVATADTLRIVNNVDIAIADTCRLIVERAIADTCRQIVRVENAVADTVVRVPHILRYVIEDNPVALRGAKSLRNTPAVSLVNSFKDYGITGVNITLNEKTLSDVFQIETTHPMEITDAVKGQLLDYPFNFLVEETNQRDFIQTVKGMYDVDKLLYTQFFIPEKIITGTDHEEEIKLDSAADYLRQAADYLGFTANILIDDFTPYQDFSSSQTTYRDLLTAIFGWTSRLPQRQINVFIRSNTLHCIQRGKETSTFDISNLPHSRPTINKSLIRSLWNKPNPDSYSDDDNQVPFSGNISYSTKDTSVSLHYDAGLLIDEKSVTDNGKIKSSNQSNFTYWKDADDIYYLNSKENISSTINDEDGEKTKIVVTSTTEYTYRENGD